MTGLEKLYLDQNPVTDKGLEQLRKLTHLKRLDLCLTKVSGAEVRKIQRRCPSAGSCVKRCAGRTARGGDWSRTRRTLAASQERLRASGRRVALAPGTGHADA